MASDVEKLEEAEREVEEVVERDISSVRPLKGGDSSSVKQQIKKDCDSRKRLEERLDQERINKQVQEYDFDDCE